MKIFQWSRDKKCSSSFDELKSKGSDFFSSSWLSYSILKIEFDVLIRNNVPNKINQQKNVPNWNNPHKIHEKSNIFSK